MISEYSEIIGKKVDQLFRESGMDQEEFGRVIGQEQSTVSKIIKGKWKNPTLKKMLGVVAPFQKPLAWLLSEDKASEEHGLDECLRRVTAAATGKRPAEAEPADPNLAAIIARWAQASESDKMMAIDAIGISWIDAKRLPLKPSKAK